MRKTRTGRFFNNRYNRTTPEGYKIKSTREMIEYEGYTVYWTWGNVPDELVSASKAKRQKLTIEAEPAAYVEDNWHYITTLYRVVGGVK